VAARIGPDEDRIRTLVQEEMRTQRGPLEAGPGGRGRDDTSPAALRVKLGLDEKKAEEVARVFEKMHEGMRSALKGGQGRQDRRELMMELRRKTEADLEKLLTPEQREKLGEIGPRRPGRGGQPGGGFPGGAATKGREPGAPEVGEAPPAEAF